MSLGEKTILTRDYRRDDMNESNKDGSYNI